MVTVYYSIFILNVMHNTKTTTRCYKILMQNKYLQTYTVSNIHPMNIYFIHSTSFLQPHSNTLPTNQNTLATTQKCSKTTHDILADNNVIATTYNTLATTQQCS